MNHDISKMGENPHFSTGKIYGIKFQEKINIDTINWEKLSHRSAQQKWCNIPYNFNDIVNTYNCLLKNADFSI